MEKNVAGFKVVWDASVIDITASRFIYGVGYIFDLRSGKTQITPESFVPSRSMDHALLNVRFSSSYSEKSRPTREGPFMMWYIRANCTLHMMVENAAPLMCDVSGLPTVVLPCAPVSKT